MQDSAPITGRRSLTPLEQARLLDQAPVLVCDLKDRVLFWNAAAERLYGWPAAAAAGRNVHELLRTQLPATLETIKATLFGAGEWRGELRRTRADGTDVVVASHWLLHAEEAGTPSAILEIANDVTAARVSEARAAAVVATALDAIVTMDHEGRVVEFNPAAERMFGYSRDAVVGRALAEVIIPPASRDAHRRGLARYLETGQSQMLGRRVELTAIRADGSEVPVEVAIVRQSDEWPPRFSGHVRDLSDLRRFERRRTLRLAVTQALADATSLGDAAPLVLRAVCDVLGWDAGAFWAVDRDAGVLRCLTIWHAPERTIAAFGRATRESVFEPGIGLPGRVWSSRRSHWIPDVTQDDNFPRAAVAREDGLRGAFASPIMLGPDVLGVIEFFHREIREPDPDLLEMMTTIAGQVGQLMGREQAQLAVRDSERRFVRFMHHLPGLAWIKDLQGRYVYANDAAVQAFETTREELYGRTDADIFPPETAAQFRENDQLAVRSGGGVQMIETLQGGGRVRHSIVSKFVIPGSVEAQTLVGGIAIDITDRLGAEEALQREARQKDEFLAMLAHELRNPLAPIANALEIMKQQTAGDSIAQTFHDVALRQVGHMSRLLDDLLDVGRISQGRIELRREPVDIGALVTRTVEATLPLFESRRHELTVSLPRGPVWVMGDATRLEQILTNLLNNAAKYTDPGGGIWLTAEREGGEISLRVRDTGVGIPPDLAPRVFDLFMQVERRLDRSRGGIGVGLTLVKRLTELHGGRVQAQSQGPGQGSEFTVWLPAIAQDVLDAAPARRPSATAAFRARRVLVVDDNQDSASSLGTLLQLNGQDVRVAFDGPTALSIAQEFQPQLVLLDIGMPGMDGFEVARRLRAAPPGDHRPTIVALTGWGRDEDRRRTRESGFDEHLTKPVRIEALHRLLL
jgi:PAS domain S-box-containing protein